MLYNVIDLNSGETIASGTCQQIAHWWRRKFKDQKGNVNFIDSMQEKETAEAVPF